MGGVEFDVVDEFVEGEEGFDEVGLDAEFVGAGAAGVVGEGGHHDDGEVFVGGLAAEVLQEVEAVHFGHHDVEEHEVGGGLLKDVQCFGGTGSGDGGVALASEEAEDDFAGGG